MTTYTVTGVDDTGATDVTAAILAFIATCADGSSGSPNTIQFGTGKTYRIDTTLTLTSRNHLVIDGGGSTFQTDDIGTLGRSHWKLRTCTGIRFTNGITRGANADGGLDDDAYVAALEAQHGFEILSSTSVTIDNWQISKIYGDWVYAGISGSSTAWTDTLLVEDCYFFDNGRQGFGFVGVRNAEIRNNITRDCRRSLIDLEPNGPTYGVDNIWFHDNDFGVHRLSFLASKGYPGSCDNVLIEDNTILGTMVSEINPTGYNLRRNWTVRNNVAYAEHGTAGQRVLKFAKTDGLTVTGNTQPMQAGRDMYLCQLLDCTDFDVSGNTIVNGIGQYFETNAPDPGSDPEPDVIVGSSPVVVGSTTNTTFTTSLVLTLPPAALAGDLAVVHIGHEGIPLTFDAEWTVVESYLSPNSLCYYAVASRVLTAADVTAGTFSFTFEDGSHTYRSSGALIAIRGYGSETPDDVEKLVPLTFGFSVAVPPATVTGEALVLFFASQNSGNGAITPDQSDVEVVATVRNSALHGVSLTIGSVVYAGAGTGRDRTMSTTANEYTGCITIAYRRPTRLRLVMPTLTASRGGGRTRAEKMIAGRFPGAPREASVLKINGSYVTVDAPSTDQINEATEVFYGGHVNEVTAAQQAALEAAGYTTID